MKKYYFYVLLFILGFTLFNKEVVAYEYVIDKYDVNIVVNEDNTFDIKETITANFNVAKHGIIRSIPLKNNIKRLDGSSFTNRASVNNVNVNNEYTTSKSDGKYKITIGNANRTVVGEVTYIIEYSYNIGKDPIKEYDELYYNIIGTEWDTSISNITFTIVMPKEFDQSKLGFSAGRAGSTANENVHYQIEGNEIKGSYDGTLDAYEGLTIRCELPEDYFTGENNNSDYVYLMYIIPAVGLVISFLLWQKYGHDDEVVETVEFYPPNGLNSLDVGFLYKGTADQQCVTSLLIYLANKGYIKIVETEEKFLFSKFKGFKIVKLKEYDGNNENERMFFNGLFLYAREEGVVTNNDLRNTFYVTMGKILKNVNKRDNKNKVFEKNTLSKSIIVGILIALSLVVIISIPTIEYAGYEELGMTLFICLFYVPFYGIGIFGKIPLSFRIFWLGFTMFHSYFFFRSLPVTEALMYDSSLLIAFACGLLCVIGMGVFLKLMPKRTKYGIEMLGKLRGFKNFLETAEKEQLEDMVMKEPTYFYNILPYTYVLGVSDKWIKKFESIAIQEPTWYEGHSAFSVASFGSFMNSTMSSAQSAMSSSPSDSSGGGSSGGGSSGGGSGGGGGSSW